MVLGLRSLRRIASVTRAHGSCNVLTNVTLRDVAELLGDTEEMVRRHYAAWVSERQERLTNVLKEAFSEKPKPKLVLIPRSKE